MCYYIATISGGDYMSSNKSIQSLGKNIQQLRRRENLSPEEMAGRINASADAVRLLEQGILPEDFLFSSLCSLSSQFSIPLSDLFLPL